MRRSFPLTLLSACACHFLDGSFVQLERFSLSQGGTLPGRWWGAWPSFPVGMCLANAGHG